MGLNGIIMLIHPLFFLRKRSFSLVKLKGDVSINHITIGSPNPLASQK